MTKLKGLALVIRINSARQKLNRATADLALCQDAALSDGRAVKWAADTLTVIQERCAAGMATAGEVAAARGVLVNAMNVCQKSSNALYQAISRCETATGNLERVREDALKSVA